MTLHSALQGPPHQSHGGLLTMQWKPPRQLSWVVWLVTDSWQNWGIFRVLSELAASAPDTLLFACSWAWWNARTPPIGELLLCTWQMPWEMQQAHHMEKKLGLCREGLTV